MAISIAAPIDFAANSDMLAEAIEAIERLGTRSGGAVDAPVRRRALERYRSFGRAPLISPRWRHDYAALSFDELQWTSGRIDVPTSVASGTARAPGASSGDAPALAVENSGGLVHAGSIYLQPPETADSERVVLCSLADAKRARRAQVEAVQQHVVAADADRFAALATAFQNCGAYIEIPDGCRLDAPLQLVWSARPGAPAAVFPHTVVRVGAGAHATVVERHVGESSAFICGIVEIDVAPGGRLDYVVVQQADDGARLLFSRGARCAPGATVGWHLAELGGALVRTALSSHLNNPHARAETNAFFFARGFAHVDLITDIAHDAPHTVARTSVRSAATDRGQGRFTGAIRVHAAAKGCDATMRDDALMLSRSAYLDAVPALEISSNDVSVSHAATVGTLDEEQLFYVQSRGISRAGAERIVALAFFEPVLSGFPGETLRDEVRTALDTHLEEIPETFAS
ncbi:MAG TPA: SufD family Fe-S cluster assembly protein [Candidatus Baltobacteraceae bacterium]